MIDDLTPLAAPLLPSDDIDRDGAAMSVAEQDTPSFSMVMAENDRISGSMPVYNGTPGANGYGLRDLLDVVNPLQHIPLVNTLYRHLTGDTIKPAAMVAGGVLYGGPVGGMASLANVMVTEETGRDVTGNVTAFVMHGESPSYRVREETPETRLASALSGRGNSAVSGLPGTVLSFADLKADTQPLHNQASRYNQ